MRGAGGYNSDEEEADEVEIQRKDNGAIREFSEGKIIDPHKVALKKYTDWRKNILLGPLE